MKKKLVFWEMMISITLVAIFLVVFDYKDGWRLIGAERQDAIFVAVVSAIVTAVFYFIIVILVASLSNLNADAGSAGVATIIAIGAFVASYAIVIAATGGGVIAVIITTLMVGGVAFPVVLVPTATAVMIIIMKCKDFDNSKSFIFASLLIEVVVIISTTLTINFI